MYGSGLEFNFMGNICGFVRYLTHSLPQIILWHDLFLNTQEQYYIVPAYIKSAFVGVINEHFKTYVYLSETP